MNSCKIPCVLVAFEDVGGGRSLEVYYKSLMSSKNVFPIMAYTSEYSFANSPSWIKNKVFSPIEKVDCDPYDSRVYKRSFRTYDDWFKDCKLYIYNLKKLFGANVIWIVDSTFPKLESYMGNSIIQVFHGELFDIGSSYFDAPNDSSFRKYSLIFAHGNLISERIIKRCGLSNTDQRIKKIGRVLNDTLYRNPKKKETILQQYSLNATKQTLLYAPSWESKKIFSFGKDSQDKLRLNELCIFAQRNNLNLILRPHTISIHHYGVLDIYKRIAKKFKNVFFDDTTYYDMNGPNNSLIASDILITDLSSIAIDFMSLGKPAIFMYPDLSIGLWGRNTPSFNNVSEVSYAVKNFPQLYLLLKKLLVDSESDSIRINRKKFISYALEYTDGRSSIRFRDEIEVFATSFQTKLSILQRIQHFFVSWYLTYSSSNIFINYDLQDLNDLSK